MVFGAERYLIIDVVYQIASTYTAHVMRLHEAIFAAK